MSNLLNNPSKKKLLERGTPIEPATQFKLEEVETASSTSKIDTRRPKEKLPNNKPSSVRVKKTTRDRLNALVSLNKAETVDDLLDIMIEEYVSTHVTKDEKKQLDIIIELYRSRG